MQVALPQVTSQTQNDSAAHKLGWLLIHYDWPCDVEQCPVLSRSLSNYGVQASDFDPLWTLEFAFLKKFAKRGNITAAQFQEASTFVPDHRKDFRNLLLYCSSQDVNRDVLLNILKGEPDDTRPVLSDLVTKFKQSSTAYKQN